MLPVATVAIRRLVMPQTTQSSASVNDEIISADKWMQSQRKKMWLRFRVMMAVVGLFAVGATLCVLGFWWSVSGGGGEETFSVEQLRVGKSGRITVRLSSSASGSVRTDFCVRGDDGSLRVLGTSPCSGAAADATSTGKDEIEILTSDVSSVQMSVWERQIVRCQTRTRTGDYEIYSCFAQWARIDTQLSRSDGYLS